MLTLDDLLAITPEQALADGTLTQDQFDKLPVDIEPWVIEGFSDT